MKLSYLLLFAPLSISLHGFVYRMQVLENKNNTSAARRIVIYHDMHRQNSPSNEFQTQTILDNFNAITTSKLLGIETCSPTTIARNQSVKNLLQSLCQRLLNPSIDFYSKDQFDYVDRIKTLFCDHPGQKNLFDSYPSDPTDFLPSFAPHVNNADIQQLDMQRLTLGEFSRALKSYKYLAISKNLDKEHSNEQSEVEQALRPFDISIREFLSLIMTSFTSLQRLADCAHNYVHDIEIKSFMKNLAMYYASVPEALGLDTSKAKVTTRYNRKKILSESIFLQQSDTGTLTHDQLVVKKSLELLLKTTEEDGNDVTKPITWGIELSVLNHLQSKTAPAVMWLALGGTHADRLVTILTKEGFDIIYDTFATIDETNHALPLQDRFNCALKPKSRECKLDQKIKQ